MRKSPELVAPRTQNPTSPRNLRQSRPWQEATAISRARPRFGARPRPSAWPLGLAARTLLGLAPRPRPSRPPLARPSRSLCPPPPRSSGNLGQFDAVHGIRATKVHPYVETWLDLGRLSAVRGSKSTKVYCGAENQLHRRDPGARTAKSTRRRRSWRWSRSWRTRPCRRSARKNRASRRPGDHGRYRARVGGVWDG